MSIVSLTMTFETYGRSDIEKNKKYLEILLVIHFNFKLC